MKYIPFLIRKVLDSYRDTIKIQQFLNLKSLNGSLIGLKIFFIKFFYSFSFLRNFRGPKYIKIRSSKTDQNFFLNEQVDINKTVAQIDKDGFYYIMARKKEIIKVGGKRVSPKEIEAIILSIPEVIDCTITGVEDNILGESIQASIVLNGKLDEYKMREKILQKCSQNLSLYKIPQKVIFEKSIQMNATGKKTN